MTSYYERVSDRWLAVLDTIKIEFYMEAFKPYDVRWLITRLNVPKQGRCQGVATRLLTKCCAEADSVQEPLYLEFSPYPDTDPKRLKKLYERFGFKDTKLPGLMQRLPQTTGE